jgi:FkbM family methyltransferase
MRRFIMSMISKMLAPLVRILPAAPCVWNGCVLWLPCGTWQAFRVRYEELLAPLLLRELRSAAVFLDVGAHHGYWTTWACRLNRSLHAVAVEPSRVSSATLKRFVACNRIASRVTVLEACLSTQGEGVVFYDSGDVTAGVSEEWAKSRGQNVIAYRAASITLDQLVAKQLARFPTTGTVVCKLDVEGHEEAIFENCRSLTNPRVRYFVEVHNCEDIQESSTYRNARASGREVVVLGRCYQPHVTVMF